MMSSHDQVKKFKLHHCSPHFTTAISKLHCLGRPNSHLGWPDYKPRQQHLHLGHQTDVDVAEVGETCSELKLPESLDKRHPLNVSYSPSQLREGRRGRERERGKVRGRRGGERT